MTGVEAISNGVPAFKPVEWQNARKVMAWLGVLLGVMFLGISFLTAKIKPMPSEKETVISQVTRAVVGHGPLGDVAFIIMQVGDDADPRARREHVVRRLPAPRQLPRATTTSCPSPLTQRGRRLVFANGIVALAALATLLTVAFQADVHNLIPALRDRRVHVVHALAGRHGASSPHAQGGGLASGALGQRDRRDRDRRRGRRHRGHQVHARRLDHHA